MRGSLSLFRLLSLRPSPLVSALPRANPPSLFLSDSLSLSLALVLIHYLSLLILLSRILRHSHSRGITVRVFVIARLSRSRGSCPPPPCHFLLANFLRASRSRFHDSPSCSLASPFFIRAIVSFYPRTSPVYTPPPASSHPLSLPLSSSRVVSLCQIALILLSSAPPCLSVFRCHPRPPAPINPRELPHGVGRMHGVYLYLGRPSDTQPVIGFSERADRTAASSARFVTPLVPASLRRERGCH